MAQHGGFCIIHCLTRVFIPLLYVVFNFVNEVRYVNHVGQMSVSSLIYFLPFPSVFEEGVLTSAIMIVDLSIFPSPRFPHSKSLTHRKTASEGRPDVKSLMKFCVILNSPNFS